MTGRNWLPGEALATGRTMGWKGVSPDLHKMPLANECHGLSVSFHGAFRAPWPSAPRAWTASQGRTGVSQLPSKGEMGFKVYILQIENLDFNFHKTTISWCQRKACRAVGGKASPGAFVKKASLVSSYLATKRRALLWASRPHFKTTGKVDLPFQNLKPKLHRTKALI